MKRKINIGNAICSTSLFHFTRKKSDFKKILNNGLRYSYSIEFLPQFFSEINRENAFSIPIICFCDIPLSRISYHVRKYGCYGIGLNKRRLIEKLENTINPIIYINSNEILQSLCNMKIIAELIQDQGLSDISNNHILALFDNNYIRGSRMLNNIETLYAFFKPCEYNGIDYTLEREWRAMLKEDLNKGISWNSKASLKEFSDVKGRKKTIANASCSMFNKLIGNNPLFHLQFLEKDLIKNIDYIIVPDSSLRDWCIEIIYNAKTLFGSQNPDDNTKLSLISKICCLDQLEKDY